MLPSSYTGVEFVNQVTETRQLNVFTYRNFYNGGGVALGDLTGDGLPELMLTSNLGENRLYQNEGDLRFRDVTGQAGVAAEGFWSTGVTFADVNGDGLLDIYVCNAGPGDGRDRANHLYIHQGIGEDGVPVFAEAAEDHGIADRAYSTHAAFFDYDRDGDLDLYLVNNSPRPVSSFGLRNIRAVRDSLGGDRLYRNDGEHFVDVSERAAIFGSEIGFGLGVAVSDLDRDGWPDLYVTNDFFERDYLYINQRNGTFADRIDRQMPYISYFSMGLDVADIDNDGWPDVYVTDMLPGDERRLKLTASFEDWTVYQARLKNDYHHQFMRNMLHRNNRNGTFSETGQMAGVARTDWSWSALIADYDLDGFKDIHVTNGLLRDVTSQDYISFLADPRTMATARRGEDVDFLRLIEAMTSTPLSNHAFRNRGDMTFSEEGPSWGLDTPAFSNGAAYGDLDGDGDLDLVVSNVNQEAFVYRNEARQLTENSYLQVVLEGEGRNTFAIGARVALRTGSGSSVQELSPSRGFQSSVDYVLTFGLGIADTVPELLVDWPDGRRSTITDVAANQRIMLRQSNSAVVSEATDSEEPLLSDVTEEVALPFVHVENAFVDFDREPLIPRMLSTEGPLLAVADVNGDGLADVFIGGAKDQAGRLLVHQRDGQFVSMGERVLEADRASEDMGALFFDANGDGLLDLYVASGGNEFSDISPALQDRLYLNDGSGHLRKAVGHLPAMPVSSSVVIQVDIDGDPHADLFVGGRVVPWQYGTVPPSFLLRNDGNGRFRDVTQEVAPELARIGMVTDALWQDVDRDGRWDLVVVGEWMPISIFRNTGDGRLERLDAAGLEKSRGWWNRIVPGDFTGDGRIDFVVGNLGLNTRLRAGADEPLTMYVTDFNGDGFVEQVLAMYDQGAAYPLALRTELTRAVPALETRFATFDEFAGRTVDEIFAADELANATRHQAHTFATSLVRNNGDGSFTLLPLPHEAQIAPVYGMLAKDLTGDGKLDLLLAGNFDGVEPEIGRMSAGYGLLLRGEGDGTFAPVDVKQSGFFVPGEARDIETVTTPGGDLYVVARNGDRPLVFRLAR